MKTRKWNAGIYQTMFNILKGKDFHKKSYILTDCVTAEDRVTDSQGPKVSSLRKAWGPKVLRDKIVTHTRPEPRCSGV